MKGRDWLGWAALGAAIVVTASAEYQLARACGFGPIVAAGVPAALDIYAVRALRAHRDVFAVVLAMIGVNAAAHLVAAGLIPVTWHLVTAVSAIAPLVLWRVHALREVPAGTGGRPVSEPAEPVAVPVVPPGARLLPVVPPAGAPAVRLERAQAPVLGEFSPLPELPPAFGGTALGQAVSRPPVPAGTGAEPRPEPAEPRPEPRPEPAEPRRVPGPPISSPSRARTPASAPTSSAPGTGSPRSRN
ncbi:hypothetical protein [Streptomyces aidingensis]|uniref:DUF2637 domain-containing protein n=1 Tax=Streptomyces aidingensis TaxID=910347 RepID=A0A1I1PS35_9ACTN|nr:hypothetical protein [Streptomyces aidingensis]SFD12565.1 hypothetical protein SAMN05421773_11016 [Streptomyces aidingensis]